MTYVPRATTILGREAASGRAIVSRDRVNVTRAIPFGDIPIFRD